MSARRRPWTRTGILAIAVHHGLELAAGIGVPGEPVPVQQASGRHHLRWLAERGRRPPSAVRQPLDGRRGHWYI
jgi:hypothetical protein